MDYPAQDTTTMKTKPGAPNTEAISYDVLKLLHRADDWALSTTELASKTAHQQHSVLLALRRCDDPALECKQFDSGYLWRYRSVSCR